MTVLTRRVLLRAGAAMAALAPLTGAFTAHAAADNPYARSRWAKVRNATLTFSGAAGAWSATLVSVGDLPQAAAGDEGRFGLTFRTAAAGPGQGTYTVQRPGFAATQLFVVPGDASRRTYEAVVNRV